MRILAAFRDVGRQGIVYVPDHSTDPWSPELFGSVDQSEQTVGEFYNDPRRPLHRAAQALRASDSRRWTGWCTDTGWLLIVFWILVCWPSAPARRRGTARSGRRRMTANETTSVVLGIVGVGCIVSAAYLMAA